jgi:uncharacterized protein (DUF302 family)
MSETVTRTPVAFQAAVPQPFDRVVERCREELAAEGFGVLTEIDVKATLKKKLDVDVAPYLILGACHPPSAHRALAAAPEVGVLLPCNVTVSEEGGRTVVRAMRPAAVAGLLDRPALGPLMEEVGAALERVVARVAAVSG